MKIDTFTIGPLATNCYLVTCETTNESVLIDPGDTSKLLLETIESTRLKAVLLTHGHFDHIAGINKVLDGAEIPVLIHREDTDMLIDPQRNGSFMIGQTITAVEASGVLADGDIVRFGESSLDVIHTPGHTRGGISFVSEGAFVIAGDTLFKMSVGRWDLPGGDYGILMNTIQNIFAKMPDDTIVYPGHGERTSIGSEKSYNQFMVGS